MSNSTTTKNLYYNRPAFLNPPKELPIWEWMPPSLPAVVGYASIGTILFKWSRNTFLRTGGQLMYLLAFGSLVTYLSTERQNAPTGKGI